MRKRTYQYRDQSLEATFAGIIRDNDWEQKYDQYRVFAKWRELVGADTAAHTRPFKVVKDVLWLEVDNSAWMQQLQFQKIVLLDTLNESLRVSYFSDIRFTVKKQAAREEGDHDKPLRRTPPSAIEIEQFEKQVAFIEDDDVREALTRYWYISRTISGNR
jgi:hypothetical protein